MGTAVPAEPLSPPPANAVRALDFARSLVPAALALALLGACGRSTPTFDASVQSVGTDTVFVLRPGQEVRAPDSVMRLWFLGVRNDSRCPVDVVCVWQGDAETEIGVAFGMGPTVPYVLHTGLEPRSVELGLYRITLVEVRPTPLSTSRILPEQYRAALRLERIPTPAY